MKKVFVGETSSTNELIKEYLGEEEVVVCARRQTGGKGTKGRSFLSEEGGVYLSFLTFPHIPAGEAFTLVAHAAVAVCRTAKRYGADPAIKWPNDVLIRRRKLCGILTENTCSNGEIVQSIVGIGLNVTNDVSALGGLAVTLSEAVKRPLCAEEVRDTLIEEYRRPSGFEEYLSFVRFLGKPIEVSEKGETYVAVAKEIQRDGRLCALCGEEVRLLAAAEIRLLSEE